MMPTVFAVTSPADDGSTGTLRWAIGQANAAATPSAIDIQLGSTPATITLTQGQFVLSNTSASTTIYDGPGEGPVTISGNDASRVFLVNSHVTVSLSGLTISGGSTASFGGGLDNAGGTLTVTDCTISGSTSGLGGGGLINRFPGALTLTDSTIRDNSAFGAGGGLSNSGVAAVNGCDFTSNRAGTSGGAIFNDDTSGNATVSNCHFTGNTAGTYGGAIGVFEGALTIVDSSLTGNTALNEGGGVFVYSGNYGHGLLTMKAVTVSANSAANGGGVFDANVAKVTDSTIADNTATNGGGLLDQGSAVLTLVDSTVSGNSAAIGGGLDNTQTATATLTDTIVAGNTQSGGSTASDIGGTAASAVTGRHNLIGTGGSGGITGGSGGNIVLTGSETAGLSPLGDYGGPTLTIALLPNSPAIGAGVATDYPGTSTPVTTDQRGLARPGTGPDIGAFQTDPLVVNTTIDGTGSPSGGLSLRQAVNLADVLGAAETITFSSTVFATAMAITLDGSQLVLSDTGGTQTITGPAAGVAISGGGKSRVFEINSGVTASLSGLTISGGTTTGSGGGLYNLGTVTLTGCTISGSSAAT